MPAWLFGGTRQRTKRLEKSASEGDTRIDDNSGGSPLTIEIGAEFPIGITARKSRSPEWFDTAHSAATGPPTVPVTAGGGQSSGSTPSRRPMIRMLPDRKTVTARHPYQG